MADYASESGHWYKLDGTPCYTIKGKNGNERPTTLRDARTLNLLPSVTGIIRLAAAPGLENWKQNQILLSAMTLPRVEGELDESFMRRVVDDSREQAKRAAQRGEDIHGAIECHYRGSFYAEKYNPWVSESCEELRTKCGLENAWLPEKSYAYKAMYGCRIDLHSNDWLVDVKTKERRDQLDIYDEHCMQLAANAKASGQPIKHHGILFVGRDEPWAELIRVEPKDIQRGWDMFMGLFMYWQAKTGHYPRVE